MRKLNFLFWNLNKKNIINEVINIVVHYNIDVIILAESEISPSELLLNLNKTDVLFSANHPLSQCQKIQIYSKFDYSFISPHEEDSRATIRKLELPLFEAINIVAVHLPDKSKHTDESQSENVSLFVDKISRFEKENTDRTIIVGDFNMNPFEKGMVKANGFNAVMSSQLSQNEKRTVQGREYKYFYNPMWSLYGDVKNNVAGSYYYNHSELVTFQWNIFDQVLIRPSLIPNFIKESIVFLDSDGEKSLLTKNGLPNKRYSDHLPLFFTIKLNEL